MTYSPLVTCVVRAGVGELHRDGGETIDCAFVGDVVAAKPAGVTSHSVSVANIGSRLPLSMNEVIAFAPEVCGPVEVFRGEARAGDPGRACADTAVRRSRSATRSTATLEQVLRAMVAPERADSALMA